MSTTTKKKITNGWTTANTASPGFGVSKPRPSISQDAATGTDMPTTGNSQPQHGAQNTIQGGVQRPSQSQGGNNGNSNGTVQAPAATQTGLAGVSSATQQALDKLTANGYTPSQNVLDALAGLDAIIANQPGDFSSQYTDQLDGILSQILGRGPFQYDLESDPMFQQFRQQYMQAGRNAMQDTMGQAAALTGGYGSSYATTAGQQAYNQHLQQLNDRIPELHQMALDAYNAEGDALSQQYALINDAYNRDYGQWQDQYNRWLGERDFAQGQYDTERGFDYDQYNTMLNYWQNMANMEQGAYESDRSFGLQSDQLALDRLNADRNFGLANQQLALDREGLELDRLAMQQDQDNANRKYYYSIALDMLDMGKVPPDSILLQAGLSADEIAALKADTGSSSGKGSSGKGSNKGSGNSGPKDYESYMALLGLGNKLGTKTGSGSSSGSDPNWLGKAASTAKAAASSASSLQSVFDKYNKK